MDENTLVDLDNLNEEELFSLFDRERAIKLVQFVSTGFFIIGVTSLLSLAALLFVNRQLFDPAFRLIAVGMFGATLLFFTSWWYAFHDEHLPSGITVVVGQLVYILSLQIGLERTHGLDAIVVGLFIITALPIGLSGVVGNAQLMLVTVGTSGVLDWLICFVITGHQRMATGSAALMFGVIFAVQIAIAALIALAAKFYLDTLSKISIIGKAYQHMRHVDRLKDNFIKNVNHELRNPMMALSASVITLQRKWHQMPEDARERFILAAVKSDERVQAILDVVLDFQRIQDGVGKFTLAVVPVRDVVDTSVSITRMASSLDLHKWIIDVPRTLAIWGDAVLLQEVLSNLLSNANKYSNPDTRIEITGRFLSGTNGQTPLVEIRVRDYGLGVPPEGASRLFRRLSRLQRDIEQNIPGSGLGLALCKMIVEAMGGTIRFESSGVEGEGTTFIFALPAAISQQVVDEPVYSQR